jgi:type III secretory pathway lipoprotein EscJ
MNALFENVKLMVNKIQGVVTLLVHIMLLENDHYSNTDTSESAAIFLTNKVGSNLD